jgi:hypothetical protein
MIYRLSAKSGYFDMLSRQLLVSARAFPDQQPAKQAQIKFPWQTQNRRVEEQITSRQPKACVAVK